MRDVIYSALQKFVSDPSLIEESAYYVENAIFKSQFRGPEKTIPAEDIAESIDHIAEGARSIVTGLRTLEAARQYSINTNSAKRESALAEIEPAIIGVLTLAVTTPLGIDISDDDIADRMPRYESGKHDMRWSSSFGKAADKLKLLSELYSKSDFHAAGRPPNLIFDNLIADFGTIYFQATGLPPDAPTASGYKPNARSVFSQFVADLWCLTDVFSEADKKDFKNSPSNKKILSALNRIPITNRIWK